VSSSSSLPNPARQVFKLMLPHFRFTLDINSKARASLINAGGIIEDTFTAGDRPARPLLRCRRL
jgi:hypothetical protein